MGRWRAGKGMGRRWAGQRDVKKVGVVKGWEEGGWGRGMRRSRLG